MSQGHILFVDPEAHEQDSVVQHLKAMGLDPVVCQSAESLVQLRHDRHQFRIALVGAAHANGELKKTVSTLRELDPEMVMICAVEPTTQAHLASQTAGADEIIARPYSTSQLEGAVRMGLELRRLRDEIQRLRELLETRQTFHGLVGGSEPMLALYRYLEQIARGTAPILIQSEPGTEFMETVIALQCCSPQADSTIKRFDGKRLAPDELISFMKQMGADKSGLLWIDNVEKLSASVQQTLMEWIGPEGKLGHWRLITSTESDLAKAVEQKQFRRDLFYRLSVFVVTIPPLRQRLEDLPLLAADRLRGAVRLGGGAKRLSYRALMAAAAHDWPRNVAELESALRWAADRATEVVIEAEDFPPEIAQRVHSGTLFSSERSLREAKVQFETEYYRDLLIRTQGNMSLAAKISKVGRPYLYKKIRDCHLDPDTFRN